jgi:uncharacterized protein
VTPDIPAALASIEQQHSVRILLAVESGSRAWGFASVDSDYDVRFIYTHALDWYLRVSEQRDVIEVAGPNLLDASGWELRKTLRLFAKCNLALNEWLNSPVIYQEAAGFRSQMQALIPSFFNPIAAVHHYMSMARVAYDACSTDGVIRTKKLFYALRALLACRWIERHLSQPPTEFARLVEEMATESQRSWIAGLMVRKSQGREGDEIVLSHERRSAISSELTFLAEYASRAPRPPKGSDALLDNVLTSWVDRSIRD